MKLLAVVLVLVPLAFGGMHQVWEVRLGNQIKEPAGWEALKQHSLLDAAFSPDGKLLAVTIDDHHTQTMVGTHVLVVDVGTPRTRLRQYDVRTCGAPLQWAPGANAILVCGYALKFPGGATCSAIRPRPANLPPVFPLVLYTNVSEFWLDASHFVHADRLGLPSVQDEDCHKQPTARDEILALVREPREAPMGWPPLGLHDYKLVRTSKDPLRVLAEHQRFGFFHRFDLMAQIFDGAAPVDRRVVWDVAAGRVVATWKPFKQSVVVGGFAYRNCAMSPDGQFVVEGGDGTVRLYRLD